MLPQESPNRWSCLPTAFAIIAQMLTSELITAIGHDGSEILWPSKPEPYRRRGFHVQEITDVLWYKGFAITTIERVPTILTEIGDVPVPINSEISGDCRIKRAIQGQRAVLYGLAASGNRHAIAYERDNFYCPSQGWLTGNAFTAYVAYLVCPRGWMIAPSS